MSTRALFIEDDDRLALFTAEYLEQRGVIVTRCATGEQGIAKLNHGPFDVVILDIMLPGADGFEVCRQIRARSAVPIVMVTARTEELDRVLGLELGADDYVLKPFSVRELLARINAVVRRASGKMGPPGGQLTAGRITLDRSTMRVQVDGKDVSLTTSEFELLLALAERPGRVLSREQLLEITLGSSEETFDRAVDVRIWRLRQKLGDNGKQPMIRTIRGAGYVLAADEGS